MRPSNQKNARLFAWIQENLDQFQQVDIVDEPTVDTPKVRLVVPAHTRDMVDAETQQCVEGAVGIEYDAMVDSRDEAAQYRPKLYIVIPALNEEAIIGDTLKSIEAAVECEHEIIVVNDHGSTAMRDWSTTRGATVLAMRCRSVMPRPAMASS